MVGVRYGFPSGRRKLCHMSHIIKWIPANHVLMAAIQLAVFVPDQRE